LKIRLEAGDATVREITEAFGREWLGRLPAEEISLQNDRLRIKLRLLPEITASVRWEAGRAVLYNYSRVKVGLLMAALKKALGAAAGPPKETA
jgi:hypothetical protein